MTQPQTLFEKIWNNHLVDVQDDGIHLIYIDRHLLHEVLSPQAFEARQREEQPWLYLRGRGPVPS